MSKTHAVAVPGIGDFTFRQRTMRDAIRIEAEAGRILGGPTEDGELNTVALAMATLIVLTQERPAEWDVNALDPFDEKCVAHLMAVHGGLRDAERRFRTGAGADAPVAGASA